VPAIQGESVKDWLTVTLEVPVEAIPSTQPEVVSWNESGS
jgi:hypothetical protein